MLITWLFDFQKAMEIIGKFFYFKKNVRDTNVPKSLQT